MTTTGTATITLAGQQWNTIHRSRYVLGLQNARGTVRQVVPGRNGTGYLTDMRGRHHRIRGNSVRVLVVGDLVEQVA